MTVLFLGGIEVFIADGAKWIWERVTRLWQRLGLVGGVRCRELVDFFWHEEHAEQMLLLRAYYKSKHWQVLTNKAIAPPLANAA